MKLFKSIVAAVARACGTTRQMANALDHKAMLYKLLGLANEADDTIVNSRYEEAMKCDSDEDAKKIANELKAATDAKTAAEKAKGEAETLAANEKKEKDDAAAKATKAETDVKAEKERADKAAANFANERKERLKLVLDAKVTANHITGAERTAFEAEFANADFDATMTKLNAKTSTKLPTQRQPGTANLGSRRNTASPTAIKRREQIAQFVNEEQKKPQYAHLPDGTKYSAAFTAVLVAHPELKETETA